MPASTNSSVGPDPSLWVTILAGGGGTRFWPASTLSRPKQLLPLASPRPLILDTWDRATGLTSTDRIRILTGDHLLDPFRGVLGDQRPETYMVEPKAKGTGPILAWAAWEIARVDPDAVIVSLHADHFIHPVQAFLDLVRAGAETAGGSDALFTIAVPPTRPETGYGYIRPGEASPVESAAEVFQVRSFVEKPDAETAAGYVEAGYLWNSGIFLWRAQTFLDEVRTVAPEIWDLVPFLESGDVEGFFDRAPFISVDEAVLERSENVASLMATFEWDDVGTWEALARMRESDARGNVCLAEVHAIEADQNIVMADEGAVVLFGVEDLVVVRHGNLVLVADRGRTPELKALLEQLPPEVRDED